MYNEASECLNNCVSECVFGGIFKLYFGIILKFQEEETKTSLNLFLKMI